MKNDKVGFIDSYNSLANTKNTKRKMIQMSKIYDKYIQLKSSSNHKENTLYLFKSGLFFIFIDKDAQIISSLLNLKLGQLNDTIVKCGFPANSLQKYLKLLKSTPYRIEIVSSENDKPLASKDYLYGKEVKNVVEEIIKTNIDSLSISEAYNFLYDIQCKLNAIHKEFEQNETKKKSI